MKPELAAYMAGVIDADGSISISTVAASKQYVIKVAVANTNLAMIQTFVDSFGGKIRKRVWKNPKWKDCYEWNLTARKAALVIYGILPYLIVKRRQALLALRLHRLKSAAVAAKARYDASYMPRRHRVYQKIKDRCLALNKRGKA